jgi:hypothetical protein
VAGVANASQSHFVAVLDPARVSGRSPENPGTAFACLECGDAGPLQYFLLPRGDVSGHAVFPPVYAPDIQTFPDGSVQLRVSENSEPAPAEILYEFSSPSAPQRARFTDRYWDWHNRLRVERRIDHGAETCPLSGRLDVRHWTPASGWQLVGLPSH